MILSSTTKYLEVLENEPEVDPGLHFPLNGSGLIHMERRLPFMIVYRPEEGKKRDSVIENLVKNEASYMICTDKSYPEFRQSLQKLIKHMSDEFGAFLLLEVWPAGKMREKYSNQAEFELMGPGESLSRTAKPIQDYIDNMDLAGLTPRVSFTTSEKRCPDQQEPLLERKFLKKWECLLLGLKIEPFYLDPVTHRPFPLLERKLYSGFSTVFRKSVYNFVKVQTKHKASGFQSLARRKSSPEVWNIDQQLVEIDDQIKFLMLVSPVNGQKSWKEFKRNSFSKPPVFHYRMIPTDPELLKRALYNIRIEDINDPTIGFLFREKRLEVDKMLTMLSERDSKDFLYGSLQVFGSVSKSLLSLAREILNEFPLSENSGEESGENSSVEEEKKSRDKESKYTAGEFADLAREEYQFLKQQSDKVEIKVVVKNTIDNLMVNKGILHIPSRKKYSKKRAGSLLQHEVGTHVLTYYNGKNQPLKLLSSGVPGYEELQEGIAVLAEHLAGNLSVSRMQVLAARVVAADSMINDYNFIKTFQLLTDEYHFKPKKAFFLTTRVYRAGGLTKDILYLRGLCRLVEYLKGGNSLEPLLIGKIRQTYIPITEELISRKILKPIQIKPRYLTDPAALERLSKIRTINKITELVNHCV